MNFLDAVDTKVLEFSPAQITYLDKFLGALNLTDLDTMDSLLSNGLVYNQAYNATTHTLSSYGTLGVILSSFDNWSYLYDTYLARQMFTLRPESFATDTDGAYKNLFLQLPVKMLQL